MTDSHGWTPERKAKQAELIHQWAPWEKSTGPRTDAGKEIVGQNAHRFTFRKALILANWLYKQQQHCLKGRPHASIEIARRVIEAALCEPCDVPY